MTTPLTREAALEAVAMAMSYRADGYPMDRSWDLAMQYRRCSSEVLAAAPPAIRAALGLDCADSTDSLRAERDALAKRVGELEREVNALDESLDGELRGTEDPPWEPPYPQVQHAHSSGKGA